MPPQAYGVKVISTGMFTRGNQPVTWRGPMLHRALQQFLSDVYLRRGECDRALTGGVTVMTGGVVSTVVVTFSTS